MTAFKEIRIGAYVLRFWPSDNGWMCGITPEMMDAIAQAEKQEPVAKKRVLEWVEYLKRKSDNGHYMNIPSEMSSGECWELAKELEQFINTTLQPQREWVGLTDEERNTITRHHAYVDNIIKATEAKLKQKNGYAEEKNT